MTSTALFVPSATARAVPAARLCAHCGETLRSVGEGAFCCAGCASAHGIIDAAGLGVFYRRLEEKRAHRPVALDTDFIGFARPVGTDEAELDLLVDGLDCPACVWLLESLLARNPMMVRARASLSTRRLSLRCPRSSARFARYSPATCPSATSRRSNATSSANRPPGTRGRIRRPSRDI